LDQSFPASKRDLWTAPFVPTDAAKFGEYLKARNQLMTNILKIMADNRLDAIVHKTVEHQPTLIKDGINPPYVSQKGVRSSHFLVLCFHDGTFGFTSTICRWDHVFRPSL